MTIFDGLKCVEGHGYFYAVCQEFSHSKQGPYISTPAQSYCIDKIQKHFGGVLKFGYKGNDPTDYSPPMGNIHFNSLKRKREREHGQAERTIEMLRNASETSRHARGKVKKLWKFTFTPCTPCAKTNIPNDRLDNLLCMQMENGVDLMKS